MKKLLQHIRLGEALEIKEAGKQHGKLFASMNEAFGVLVEEQAEAIREEYAVGLCTDPLLWAIQGGDKQAMEDYLEEIEEHALLAACEYVQVAAVARKALRTLRQEAKRGR